MVLANHHKRLKSRFCRWLFCKRDDFW